MVTSGQTNKWSKRKVVKMKSGQNTEMAALKLVKIKSGQMNTGQY